MGNGLSRSWFVLYTASNNEKTVERYLRMREVETFLPLHKTTKRWKNRTTATTESPLFPGYVFVRIARSESSKVLSIPRVYSMVGNGGFASQVPDADISALQSGLQAEELSPWPYLNIGTRARIITGSLAGLEGIVVRNDDQVRIVISVDLIHRSVAVHVDADDIEVCD